MYYYFHGAPLLAQAFLIYSARRIPRAAAEIRRAVGVFKSSVELRPDGVCAQYRRLSAEMLRGAIESVPKGQWEGANSLGLPKWLTFVRIILPQALIVALRPYGNEIILMIKRWPSSPSSLSMT